MLRDGRNLLGVLRSYDQYGKPSQISPSTGLQADTVVLRQIFHASANLVLESTIERLFHAHKPIYTDAYVGLFLIRGENVVLLGEVVSLKPCVRLGVVLKLSSRFFLQDLDVEDEVPLRPAANAEEAKEIMASIEEKKVRITVTSGNESELVLTDLSSHRFLLATTTECCDLGISRTRSHTRNGRNPSRPTR